MKVRGRPRCSPLFCPRSTEQCRPAGVGLHPPPFFQAHPPPCPYEDEQVHGVASWVMLCG